MLQSITAPVIKWRVFLLQSAYIGLLFDCWVQTIFLTHVGIRQMPTWLPKNHFIASAIFCRRDFFCHFESSELSKKTGEKLYTQTNACLLHISRNFKDIFKYICFTLYLQQTVNNWESAIIFIDRCCLPCFFSADIRSNQFRIDLII